MADQIGQIVETLNQIAGQSEATSEALESLKRDLQESKSVVEEIGGAAQKSMEEPLQGVQDAYSRAIEGLDEVVRLARQYADRLEER